MSEISLAEAIEAISCYNVPTELFVVVYLLYLCIVLKTSESYCELAYLVREKVHVL